MVRSIKMSLMIGDNNEKDFYDVEEMYPVDPEYDDKPTQKDLEDYENGRLFTDNPKDKK